MEGELKIYIEYFCPVLLDRSEFGKEPLFADTFGICGLKIHVLRLEYKSDLDSTVVYSEHGWLASVWTSNTNSLYGRTIQQLHLA